MNQSDIYKEVFFDAAIAEFYITNQKVQLQLPVDVPHILSPLISKMLLDNKDVLANVLGQALLALIQKKVILKNSLLWNVLKKRMRGGE